MAAVAAGTAPGSRRRRRRLTWSRFAHSSAPYLLVAPVLIVIGAILGYPIYKLVTLSLQRYGLEELIAQKGVYIGLDNFSSVLHDPPGPLPGEGRVGTGNGPFGHRHVRAR